MNEMTGEELGELRRATTRARRWRTFGMLVLAAFGAVGAFYAGFRVGFKAGAEAMARFAILRSMIEGDARQGWPYESGRKG